jgi:hypothetical protein
VVCKVLTDAYRRTVQNGDAESNGQEECFFETRGFAEGPRREDLWEIAAQKKDADTQRAQRERSIELFFFFFFSRPRNKKKNSRGIAKKRKGPR